jgi:hypothetical protein
MEYEEPTIIDAPGYVGKTVFDPQGKAIDRQVKADERFITTEIGPIALGPGEELSILDEKEKGEIIYIKIVTDNPYANVYLELDDYRNDQNGETHAELLYDQRKSNAEGQFYIETDGSNGKGYPMVWNPQTNPTAYSKRVKLRVTNPLRRNSNLYGSDLSYASKGGQPTPIQPLHMGGGSFTHSGLAAVSLETLSKAIANPIGANAAYSVDAIVNEAVFDSDGKKLGEGNPYAGLAGKPLFRRDKASMQTATTVRGDQFVNGTRVLGTEVVGAADAPSFSAVVTESTSFPGTAASPDSATSTTTLTLGDSTGATNALASELAAGDKVFIRNGGTVHFLGVITGEVTKTDGGDNGTIKFSTFPGVRNGVASFDGTIGSETHCFGTVASQAQVSPDMIIKKILVKRKRLITYEG